MAWQFNNTEPVFVQIANRLRIDIINGKYHPDEQIPSVRQLAFDASVNPNTMQKALASLEEEGLLCSRGTVGRFVTADMSLINGARERVRRRAVRDWLATARTLGISTEELINYIKEEDTL
ncbi:MAG: GntR family transcriptional regulator [Clostridia bacterium]|nr:GntR family transcriptional regulator [Clostridia bacterium]